MNEEISIADIQFTSYCSHLRVVGSDNSKLSDNFRVNSDTKQYIVTPLLTVDEGQFCEVKNYTEGQKDQHYSDLVTRCLGISRVSSLFSLVTSM